MSIIQRLLFVLLVNLFVRSLQGEDLAAEVLRTKLPIRTSYTAAVYDGQDSIYILGGYDQTGFSSRVILKFSLADENITQVASLPSRRSGGSAVFDDKNENIYYFGGYDNYDEILSADVFQFNIATSSVTEVGKLKSANTLHATIKYNSKVYLIGGSNKNSILCYDIDSNKSCNTKSIDTSYENPTAVLNGNEALVFGNPNRTSGDYPVYQVNLDTFETSFGKTDFPRGIYKASSVTVGSNAYVLGAWATEDKFILQVNLDSLELTELPVRNYITAEQYLDGTSAVCVEKLNKIYIFGGISYPSGLHDEILTIDLSPISVPPTTTQQPSTFAPPTTARA